MRLLFDVLSVKIVSFLFLLVSGDFSGAFRLEELFSDPSFLLWSVPSFLFVCIRRVPCGNRCDVPSLSSLGSPAVAVSVILYFTLSVFCPYPVRIYACIRKETVSVPGGHLCLYTEEVSVLNTVIGSFGSSLIRLAVIRNRDFVRCGPPHSVPARSSARYGG